MAIILESPWARRGYEDLAACYEAMGAAERADVLRFLVSEKFGVDVAHPDEGQRGDHSQLP